MANCTLTISCDYEKVRTDLSECTCCEETIYSKMNVLFMLINGKKELTDVVLCDSCFDCLEKQNPTV